MNTWLARVITYGVVASAAAASVICMPPLPERKPAEVLAEPVPQDSPQLAQPVWRERTDSVRGGETLGSVLQRGGVPEMTATTVLRSAPSLNPRRIPAGMRVTFGGLSADSTPTEITLHLAIDRLLRLTRTDSGWTAKEDSLPWMTDTLVVRGGISSTLYEAFDSAATELPPAFRTELAWDVADIFEWRIDMSRDLQVGDTFAVLVERKKGPQGVMRTGRVLAAAFTNAGSTIQAIRHEREGQRTRYYDQNGKSLEANFLRAPLAFRRISSRFGLRRHPILGVMRRHQGVDYAASSGTPVRAIGDGIVIAAGRRGGYGYAIDVRHANGFVSRYGHLRAFARAVRPGARVSMGQTIGFVGMTGLATAPHLHFEMLVGGVHRNPRTALAGRTGTAIPAAERPRFDIAKAQYLDLLERLSARTATTP